MNEQLLTPAMLAVLVAQFLSALADNALLIAAIGLVKLLAGDDQLVPWLQASFVLPFIVLAALVGPFADTLPKGRVMLIANSVKVVAGIGMILCSQGAAPAWLPLAAYTLAGVGAALYSPAKYGILTQLFGPKLLVKANGLMEGSTIVAILLGVLAGGWLVDHSLQQALFAITGCYTLAAALTLLIRNCRPSIRSTISIRPFSPPTSARRSRPCSAIRGHGCRCSAPACSGAAARRCAYCCSHGRHSRSVGTTRRPPRI